MTRDESKALVFVAVLLGLAGAVRVVAAPEPWVAELPAVDADSLATAVRQEDAAAKRRKRPFADGERILLNSAPADEIDRLAGVGPALAARIVAYRDSVGAFGNAEDFGRVRGVGAGLLAKNRERIDYAVPAGMRVRVSPSPPGGTSASAPLDVNRATAAQLEALPGIGPALAARILAHRDSAGGFRTLEDLRQVRGIGPAMLERMRPLVRAAP